jgi:pimeloyl-ACP methyl ester carboxylesterase
LQTPQRPFPYVEKNVTYENILAGVKLAGTLTLPEGPGPFPAVILIAGSGKNDRNETPFGHFLLLSDYLTKRGFAVLRADKRGVGESTGNYRSATSMDFAQDIEAGINFLKTIPEINSEKIGLIGHSEGAVIAPIIASRNDKVAFIVMMGGVGISGEQLLYIQAEKIARLNGADDEGIKAQTAQQKQLYPIAKMDMREEDLILKLKAVDNNISQKMIEFLINPWF